MFHFIWVGTGCIYTRDTKLWYIFVQAPVHTIASNAGVEGAVVVGKLLEQDDLDLGYDAAKGISLPPLLKN